MNEAISSASWNLITAFFSVEKPGEDPFSLWDKIPQTERERLLSLAEWIEDADVESAVTVLAQMRECGKNVAFWYQVVGTDHLGWGYHLDRAFPYWFFNEKGMITPSYVEYGGGGNSYTTDEDRKGVTTIAAMLLGVAQKRIAA